MARSASAWRTRWRRAIARLRAGPDHLAGRIPRQTGSRLLTVLALRWLRVAAETHFTAAGATIFLLSLLFAAFVMEAGRLRPGHQAPIAVLTLFVVNAAVGWLCLPRLRVSRSVPGSVMAGDSMPVEYRVRNIGRTTLWNATVEALPLPAGMSLADATTVVGALPPGQEVRVRTQIVPHRRGRYVLALPRVDTAFPFQLWRWGRYGEGERKVVVYPSFTPLREIDMSFGVRCQPGGVALTAHVGSSMEFLSCREYRHGDNPRHLHPRSWARFGTPVVREFREEYLCRTALVLDTFRPSRPGRLLGRRSGEDPVIEAAVSLAAAVADHLARSEYLVELFAAGPDIYRFEAGRSLAYFEDILDVLSCIEPSRQDPFAALSSELESEKLQMSSAILILLCWNPLRAGLVRSLTDAGVAVKVLLLNTHPEGIHGDVPDTVQQVAWEDVRDGLFTSV